MVGDKFINMSTEEEKKDDVVDLVDEEAEEADDEFDMEEGDEDDEVDLSSEDMDDEEDVDLGEILINALETPDGETVCTALLGIKEQMEIQNKILVKILKSLV